MQTIIRVEKLSKTFQQNRALNAVDLHIAAGEMVAQLGPSGSGKDSLLAELRQQEHEQLLNAHRYITRAANAGNENHIALSEQEFFIRAGQNLLALSWYANGFYYGLGIEIDLWLHAGFDAVVNGSRAHL